MVSWWGTDSYLNNKQIQIGDIKTMTNEYGSIGPFGSIVRPKSIRHNTYKSRRSNFRSETTPIHRPVQKKI